LIIMKNRDVYLLRTSAAVAACSFGLMYVLRITKIGGPVDSLALTWHLAMLFVIALVAAPKWAEAMGFGWIAVELVLAGGIIQGLPAEIAVPLRGGVHLCTSLWVAGAAWKKGPMLGLIACLLVAEFLAGAFLAPGTLAQANQHVQAILVLGWVIGLGLMGERAMVPQLDRAHP
jgi:hypothetical protein